MHNKYGMCKTQSSSHEIMVMCQFYTELSHAHNTMCVNSAAVVPLRCAHAPGRGARQRYVPASLAESKYNRYSVGLINNLRK